MDEMIYKNKHEVERLHTAEYKGYHYAILSMGFHPCAYVKIPASHPYFGKNYSECDIDCHWGLTYSRDCLATFDDKNTWWIGWDYGHCDDYAGYAPFLGGKKWTTAEICKECKNVIEQLIAKEKENAVKTIPTATDC